MVTTKWVKNSQDAKFELERFRWEFMRRSAEYQRDWKRVKRLREDPKSFSPATPGGQKEALTAVKYDLRHGMIDPKKSYDELIQHRLYKVGLFGRGLSPRGVRTYFNRGENNKLHIEIDLDKIHSIDALADVFRLAIENGYRWAEHHGLKRRTVKKKDYENALLAGDLKQQGWTHQQIAQKIFSHDFKKNPESTTRKVGQIWIRYQELVAGGWKDITYP